MPLLVPLFRRLVDKFVYLRRTFSNTNIGVLLESSSSDLAVTGSSAHVICQLRFFRCLNKLGAMNVLKVEFNLLGGLESVFALRQGNKWAFE
jgi:hypothetical protein